jgi:hypothetical protein
MYSNNMNERNFNLKFSYKYSGLYNKYLLRFDFSNHKVSDGPKFVGVIDVYSEDGSHFFEKIFVAAEEVYFSKSPTLEGFYSNFIDVRHLGFDDSTREVIKTQLEKHIKRKLEKKKLPLKLTTVTAP